ncbi:TPA: TM2 domain-containing protein, partial [Pseudomonas aeruginosa]|nr:TM2 domain-containing protein [Pseudomonas aeruginosa]
MSLQSEMLVEQKVSNAQKSTGTAYLLWFFLGGFGAHRF